jgi:hypothetical protein
LPGGENNAAFNTRLSARRVCSAEKVQSLPAPGFLLCHILAMACLAAVGCGTLSADVLLGVRTA